jgi:prephenate dehydrogenase
MTEAGRSLPLEAPLPFGRIAFLGFGLIGGSIAMALRARQRAAGSSGDRAAAAQRLSMVAWTPAGHGPAVGLSTGLLDAAPGSAPDALDGADLVILAGPPLAVLEDLDELGGRWRGSLGGALVTDVASTKASIVARAGERGLRFVGGHPMAGREVTGIEGASAALFTGRPWPVVASSGSAEGDVEAVEALARATGARPIRLDATTHDAAVAAISHVPLLASVALVEAMTADPAWRAGSARALAASGWRDATRLAAGSAEMGAGILATNAAEVAPRLRALREALDAWIATLERGGEPDPDELRARLDAARATLYEVEATGPARPPE